MRRHVRGMVLPPDFHAHHARQNGHAAAVLKSSPRGDSSWGLPPRVAPSPGQARLDWTDKGLVAPGLTVVSPVQNQEQCGDCWAFATVGAIEASYAKCWQLGPGFGVSEQYFLDVSASVLKKELDVPWDCDGGWWAFDLVSQAKGLVNPPGAPNRSDLPYQGTPHPLGSARPRPWAVHTWGYVSASADMGGLPTDLELKQALCTYGPIAAAVLVPEDRSTFGAGWSNYTGGVIRDFTNDPSKGIDHAVLIVGWDDAKRAWKVKNSWSPAWGEAGFFEVAYGCNNIGTGAAWVLAARPANLPPTPTPAPTPKPAPKPALLSTSFHVAKPGNNTVSFELDAPAAGDYTLTVAGP